MTDLPLLPHHKALLDASGVSPEVAEARGYRSITTRAELARLGFGQSINCYKLLKTAILTFSVSGNYNQPGPRSPKQHRATWEEGRCSSEAIHHSRVGGNAQV